MDPNYQIKYPYYYSLKHAARATIAADIGKQTRTFEQRKKWDGLTLCSIDRSALEYSRLEWVKYYGAKTHSGFAHSWEALYHRFIMRPSFFDLAIWQDVEGNRVLQALALGKPSRGRTHLTLNWVERSFAPTYLKGVLLPILGCAEEYAKLLGAQRVLIKRPVDPEKYARYGYTDYKIRNVKAVYLHKDL